MCLTLELSGLKDDPEARAVRARVLGKFPDLSINPAVEPHAPGRVALSAARWRDPRFDPLSLDRQVAAALEAAGRVVLRIDDPSHEVAARAATAIEVVTRYQRLLDGGNAHSAGALFARVKAVHRALHDRERPLVAADYDHALDTWRWVLRLCPDASLAVQIAALFHDVERLASESDARVEQHAPDYLAFKTVHAAAGARITAEALASAGADAALVGRVADLVRHHEQPGPDPERRLLNDADALSFFSLNACGFMSYYGAAHTRKKVAYTLARLGAQGWIELRRVRLRADIAALVEEAAASDRTHAAGAALGRAYP